MRIKNWDKFQHFKDRRPPWIKLHREILDQRDINLISDCSFRVLVGLWLIASEDKDMNGNLPDVDDIAFRLRLDKSKVIKSLKELDSFLVHDDINVISKRYQDDVPETETETEAEVSPRAKKVAKKVTKKFVKPSVNEVAEYASEKKLSINATKFWNYYEANGWKVGRNKMKDWKAAVRNWASNDYNQSSSKVENREVAI